MKCPMEDEIKKLKDDLARTEVELKYMNVDRNYYYGQCRLDGKIVAPRNKDVKITREGCMDGAWLIKISGILDEHLYDTEVAVLGLFGMKKKECKL